MSRTFIALVDASRARLLTFHRSVGVDGISEQLVEERELARPARRMRTSELFSSTRSGLGRTGGLQYGLDDHREAHVAKLDDDCARSVVR